MTWRDVVLGCLVLNGLILVPSLAATEQSGAAILALAGVLLWGIGFWRGAQWPVEIGAVVCGAAAGL